jgi:hypothetical protein
MLDSEYTTEAKHHHLNPDRLSVLCSDFYTSANGLICTLTDSDPHTEAAVDWWEEGQI